MDMKHNNITAVIFDWDLTLAYTLQKDLSLIERTAVLFQNEGVPFSVDQLRQARQKLLCDIATGKANGSITPQTKREIIYFYQQLLTRLDYPDTSQELAYRIYSAYGRLPTDLFEDVLPVLQNLSQQGIKLGVLSNHSRSVRQSIESLIGQYVPSNHITISEEVGVHKPSRTIFRLALSRLQVSAKQTIYVGDNLNVDAIGSVEKGGYRHGIWLDRKADPNVHDLPTNVSRIAHLAQVADFIGQNNQA